jgi:hypothetical protein
MFYKVVMQKKKLVDVFSWLSNESSKLSVPPEPEDKNYSFLQLPEYEDYFNQEISTVKFLFTDAIVAQEVSELFSDGIVEETDDQ